MSIRTRLWNWFVTKDKNCGMIRVMHEKLIAMTHLAVFVF